jgi:predicted peptidase
MFAQVQLRKVPKEQLNLRDGANFNMEDLRMEPNELQFLFYLPKDWDSKFQYPPGHKWPLVIYLHVCNLYLL